MEYNLTPTSKMRLTATQLEIPLKPQASHNTGLQQKAAQGISVTHNSPSPPLPSPPLPHQDGMLNQPWTEKNTIVIKIAAKVSNLVSLLVIKFL